MAELTKAGSEMLKIVEALQAQVENHCAWTTVLESQLAAQDSMIAGLKQNHTLEIPELFTCLAEQDFHYCRAQKDANHRDNRSETHPQ
jgi:hypothetical protein